MHRSLSFAIALCLAVSIAAASAMSLSDMREWLMKKSGFAMLDLKKIAEAGEPVDTSRVITALQTIRDSALDIPKAFPAGSEHVTTAASPAIWQNNADFVKKAETLATDVATALKAPPATPGDITALLFKVSADCSDCHTTYRLKE